MGFLQIKRVIYLGVRFESILGNFISFSLIFSLKFLKILESAKDFICVLKLHCDTIDGWDDEFSAQLQKISNENNFLIFEDRFVIFFD